MINRERVAMFISVAIRTQPTTSPQIVATLMEQCDNYKKNGIQTNVPFVLVKKMAVLPVWTTNAPDLTVKP